MSKEDKNLWDSLEVEGKKRHSRETAVTVKPADEGDSVIFLRRFLDPSSQSHLNFEKSAQGLPEEVRDNFQFLDVNPNDMNDAIRKMINMQAELNVMELLLINPKFTVHNKNTGKTTTQYNEKLLKIKADMTKFVKETLDSDHYSKKITEEKNIKLSLKDVLQDIERRNEEEVQRQIEEGHIIEIEPTT